MSFGFGLATPRLGTVLGGGSGVGWQIYATGDAIRNAIDNPAACGYSPHNLYTYSNTFSNGAWSKTRSAIQTNLVRNSVCAGAVSGTPGTMPTNWSRTVASNLAMDVLATGTASGLPYIDVRLYGTANATNVCSLSFETNTGIAATVGQVVTESAYITMIAGSTNGISVSLAIDERTAVAYLAYQNGASLNSSLSGAFPNRLSATFTMGQATATNVLPWLRFVPVNGQAIDITLRIAGPQVVYGSVVGDYQATSGTAATVLYTGPDGTLSASKLMEDITASNTHYMNEGVACTAGLWYTPSFYVKAGERTRCTIRFYTTNSVFASANAYFDLSAGTVVSQDAPITNATITSIGSGWYRISASQVALATATGSAALHLVSSGVTTSYSGDGSSGIYVAWAQDNLGTQPLNYVPTTTAALGSTVPGWLLTGLGGARLSISGRTSLAMEQAADGTWGFARHNMIRNSVMSGAIAGAPGTFPTNWANQGTANSLSRDVVAVGIDSTTGLPYIDMRIYGTPSGTSSYGRAFEATNQVAVVNGQTWTRAMYVAIVGGSTTNITSIINYLQVLDSVPANLAATSVNIMSSLTSSLTRFSSTYTVANATAAYIQPGLLVGYTSGQAIDITLRIAMPELYQGAARNGIMPTTSAAVYAPAVDYLAAQSAYGLRSEAASTNSIRNNAMVGAVAGTPGTLPTNWTDYGSTSGLTHTVVGVGTENGLPYIDIRYAGTTSGAVTSQNFVLFESTTQITAAQNDIWTSSFWAKIAAGTLTGFTLYNDIDERTAAGAFLTNTATPFTPTATLTRYTTTRTLTDATVARVTSRIVMTIPNATAVDLTLRVAAPQLEKLLLATSPILTWGTAVTRAADNPLVYDAAAEWIGLTEGMLYCKYIHGAQTSGSFTYPLFISDATTNNYIGIAANNSSNNRGFRVAVGGVTQVSNENGASAQTLTKATGAYKLNDFASSFNGAAVVTDSVGTIPTGLSQMSIGCTNGATNINGYVLEFGTTKRRAINAELVSLST